MWDEIEAVDAIGITWMDRTKNKLSDLLANVAIKPNDISFIGVSKVEVQTRPSMLDNVHSW